MAPDGQSIPLKPAVVPSLLHLVKLERGRRLRCLHPPQSMTNTISSSLAVRHPFVYLLYSTLSFDLEPGTSCRRRCWLRGRWSSCGGGPRPAHPHTRGGPRNAQRSHSHAARAVPVAPCAGLAHRARAHQHPDRRARRPLGPRPLWTVSRRWREHKL